MTRCLSAAFLLVSLRASAENIPAGNLFDGVGFHGGIGLHLTQSIAPGRGPGPGFSLDAQIEWKRFLIGGTLLVGSSRGGNGMVFLGGRSAIILTDSEHAPFVGFGMGHMETGALFDNPSRGLSLNGEVGFLLFRSLKVGRLSVSLQGFFPLYDECNYGPFCPDGRWTPWASVSVRLMF
jgi:hypothetical protein